MKSEMNNFNAEKTQWDDVDTSALIEQENSREIAQDFLKKVGKKTLEVGAVLAGAMIKSAVGSIGGAVANAALGAITEKK